MANHGPVGWAWNVGRGCEIVFGVDVVDDKVLNELLRSFKRIPTIIGHRHDPVEHIDKAQVGLSLS